VELHSQSLLGKAIRRREDPRLIRGDGLFTDDMDARGAVPVAFVRSSHARARILAINTSQALGSPHVLAIYSARDFPSGLSPIPESMITGKAVSHPYVRQLYSPPQLPLASDEVHYVGEPLAVVLASDPYALADAVAAVAVEYEDLTPIVSAQDALTMRFGTVHRNASSNIAGHICAEVGNIEDAFRQAEIVVGDTFHIPRLFALPIEPRCILAVPDRISGGLTAYVSNQNPYSLRGGVAAALGISPEEVRVVTPDVGGGFGAKGMIYPEEIVCCLLAHRLRQTIKWTESRSESFISTNHARDATAEARLAARRDGSILGLDVTVFQDCGAYSHYEMVVALNILCHFPSLYRIPNIRSQAYALITNKVQTAPYRGAGRPEAIFVTERLVDLLGREIGRDPAEVRQLNLVRPDQIPYSSGLLSWTGLPSAYDSGDFPAMLRKTLADGDYAGWRQAQGLARQAGRLVGIGLAIAPESGGGGPCEGATVRIHETGHVTVLLGVSSQGQSHETVFAQICAEALGADIDMVRVHGGDTSLAPRGFGTRGSRVAVNAGNAVAKAAAAVRRRIQLVASRVLECGPDDVALREGLAFVKGLPDRAVSFRDLAATVLRGPVSEFGPVLSATEYFYPSALTWSHSFHLVVVEVDRSTGNLAILRYVVVHDAGQPINPTVVEGQVFGGIAQGLGSALTEHIRYDESGQPFSGTLVEYAIPRADSMPNLSLNHLDFPTPTNSLGIKGIGEGATAGPPAALANAVADALGGKVRVNALPLTPQRVWELLQRQPSVAD
jgi:carbon-monoxide dehydrogenase large subunit